MSNERLFPFTEQPTNVFGLKFRPTVNEDFDKLDWSNEGIVNGQVQSLGHKFGQIHIEFSDKNKDELTKIITELKLKNNLRSILEIGVFRSKEESSTRVMLRHKPWETKYLGIDLVENNLMPIRNPATNVFALACDSSEHDIIMDYAKETCGVETFDLIFIDGYHSINQVMDDWRFVEHLSPGGVVLLHDSNFHPGPYCIFDAIDEKLFSKEKLCVDPLDWGLIKATRL